MRGLIGFIALAAMVGAALYAGADRPKEPTVTARIEARISHVIDGDTLRLVGVDQSIRLWGVDAPERDEAGYAEASAYLAQIASGKPLACDQTDIDNYGRIVARCFLQDGREINRLMIESGTAHEYVYFSKGYYARNKSR